MIPALVFKGISLGVRCWVPSSARSPEAMFWHVRGQQVSKLKAIDCVFIGSSRVMAAVDENAFAVEVSRLTGHTIHPFNLGLAYSTVVEQYLLLRNLFREHAEQMRGCTVFIEAPGGLPADTRGWQDSWIHPDRPDMLPPLLRAEDLVKAWTCGLPMEERMRIAKDYCCRKSTLMAQRARVATTLVDSGNKVMHRFLDRFLPPKPKVVASLAAPVDLTNRGGIRTDQEGVARNRQLAIDGARAQMGNQGPMCVTEQSVLWDLVDLVRREGGRVVFFEMPMHPVQLEPLSTPIRMEDRKRFHGQIRSWLCYYIPNSISTGDADFPDIWHLRRSLAAPFSVNLGKNWAQMAKRQGVY